MDAGVPVWTNSVARERWFRARLSRTGTPMKAARLALALLVSSGSAPSSASLPALTEVAAVTPFLGSGGRAAPAA